MGEYLEGKRIKGYGKDYYKGSLEFEGEYFNKERWNGFGKEHFPNGTLGYEGEFLCGKKNGKGKLYNYTGKLS